MTREQTLEVVRKLRSDKQLSQQVHESKTEEDVARILQIMKADGIQADARDFLEAVNVNWIIDRLEEMPGTVQYSRITSRALPQQEFDLGTELQKRLREVIEQIDKGYRRVMDMYTVAFYLGIFLVLMSVFSSLFLRQDMSTLILGGLGMADIIAALIFQPARDLQNSRGNLAQLQAAFFNWINDVYNWNRYLIHVDDEAASSERAPVFERVREVSDILVHNTERMMRLVEYYCEMYASPQSKQTKGMKMIEQHDDGELEITEGQIKPLPLRTSNGGNPQDILNIKNK